MAIALYSPSQLLDESETVKPYVVNTVSAVPARDVATPTTYMSRSVKQFEDYSRPCWQSTCPMGSSSSV